MTQTTRRDAALQLLAATGMLPSNYAPPAVRLLWRMGVDCPPPHFARFGVVAGVLGLYFGVCMGVFMALTSLAFGTYPLARVPLGAAVAGLGFGVFMALYYARGRKQHGLPRWEDLP